MLKRVQHDEGRRSGIPACAGMTSLKALATSPPRHPEVARGTIYTCDPSILLSAICSHSKILRSSPREGRGMTKRNDQGREIWFERVWLSYMPAHWKGVAFVTAVIVVT